LGGKPPKLKGRERALQKGRKPLYRNIKSSEKKKTNFEKRRDLKQEKNSNLIKSQFSLYLLLQGGGLYILRKRMGGKRRKKKRLRVPASHIIKSVNEVEKRSPPEKLCSSNEDSGQNIYVRREKTRVPRIKKRRNPHHKTTGGRRRKKKVKQKDEEISKKTPASSSNTPFRKGQGQGRGKRTFSKGGEGKKRRGAAVEVGKTWVGEGKGARSFREAL